jgi:hypothetical protein
VPQDSQFDKEHGYFSMYEGGRKRVYPKRIYLPHGIYLNAYLTGQSDSVYVQKMTEKAEMFS